jgi:hypothetical protein
MQGCLLLKGGIEMVARYLKVVSVVLLQRCWKKMKLKIFLERPLDNHQYHLRYR